MAHTSQNTSGWKAFTATAVAIAAFIRVKVDSAGLILVAGADDNWIGVTQEPVAASGIGAVRLRNSGGTQQFTASAAITRGAQLYPTTAGKVDDASAGGAPAMSFVALEAATASGDVIEGSPWSGGLVSGQESTLQFPINLASVADGDVVTNYPLPFAGTITAVVWRNTVAVTTAAKATTLNLEINTTNLTGGVVALTSANNTPVGTITAGTPVTAANVFAAGDTLSIEASSTTAFVEGAGILFVSYVAS